jgi:hypothetical protein
MRPAGKAEDGLRKILPATILDNMLNPQELTWDSPIKDLFFGSYNFSPELVDPATPPRFIRMYEDRWQVNWQLSGLPDPQSQSIMDVYITARPVAPSTITIKV